MASTQFQLAPAVADIAGPIITKHHPHLVGLPIRFVFRDKASTTAGKIKLGAARLLGGLNGFLGVEDEEERVDLIEAQGREAFFVIEVALNMWKDLTGAQKEALVDELLCRCYAWEEETKEDGMVRRLKILPFDLEGFACNIARHGLWKADIEVVAKGIAPHIQPVLDGLGADPQIAAPLALTAMRKDREETVRSSPANHLKVEEGGRGVGEDSISIGGVCHQVAVAADGERFALTIVSVDENGAPIKKLIDGLRCETAELAWKEFDAWVETTTSASAKKQGGQKK